MVVFPFCSIPKKEKKKNGKSTKDENVNSKQEHSAGVTVFESTNHFTFRKKKNSGGTCPETLNCLNAQALSALGYVLRVHM